MYKGIILSDTTAITNTNVPFTTVRNTNPNTKYDATNNAVQILSEGYYDVMATVVATSTASATVSAQLFADGVAIPGAISTITVDATGTNTFVLIDNVKVSPTYNNNFAEISVRFNAEVTVNDAILLVEKRK